MTIEIFVSTLVISATATSICIELIKSALTAFGLTYKSMPLAVIIAFLVGVAEIIILAGSTSGFSWMTAIYAVCMGVANVLGATTSYDTVKALIYALFAKSA